VAPGGLATGQSLKNYSGVITLTNATQTANLGTVTAAKNYLITDVILTTNDTAGPLLVALQIGIAPVLQGFVSVTQALSLLGLEANPQGTGGQVVALIIPAGTPGKQIAYNVFGIEQ
jgi:hypothetical protein